jgi:hypothetical protein
MQNPVFSVTFLKISAGIMQHVKPIPFYISDLNSGFGRASGIVRTDGPSLVIEFKKEDALDDVAGARPGSVREVRIPFDDLHAIQLKTGLFTTNLEITTRTLKAAAGLPGSNGSEITLKVKRKNRKGAEHAVSRIQLRLSEFRLKQLDDD